MSELRTLDISFNRIKHFPYSVGELPNLQKLDIRGNPLTGLPCFLKLTRLSILVSEWAFVARTSEQDLARVGRLFVTGNESPGGLGRGSGLQSPDTSSACFSIRSQQLQSLFQM